MSDVDPDSTAGVRRISSSDNSGRKRRAMVRSATPESSVRHADHGDVQFELVETVGCGGADELDAVGEWIGVGVGGAPPVSPMIWARCAAIVSSLSPFPATRIGTSDTCSPMCSVTWRSYSTRWRAVGNGSSACSNSSFAYPAPSPSSKPSPGLRSRSEVTSRASSAGLVEAGVEHERADPQLLGRHRDAPSSSGTARSCRGGRPCCTTS